MKKIIHFKIPLLDNTKFPDAMAIRPETTGKFMRLIKNWLGEDFYIISSPFEPSELIVEGQGISVYNFDMKQINFDDLIEMVREQIKE